MSLTIVMYNFVRDLPNTRYPRLKGMLPKDFKGQLDYIDRNYTVCTLNQVIKAAQGGPALPPKSCLLTFDDGVIDHYTTVFPRLISRGMSAVFFPPAKPILEHVVLDAHKIQFILAAMDDPKPLAALILELLKPHRQSNPEIEPDNALLKKHSVADHFESPEIGFIHRMLLNALPCPVRQAIMEELFNKYVAIEESVLSHELYMDLPQLKTMAKQGMAIGGHGYDHLCLCSCDESSQAYEIRKSIEILALIHNLPPKEWAMCYPYGNANDNAVKLLKSKGCVLGISTQTGVAADLASPLNLPRLCAADLPVLPKAPPCEWTTKA